MKINEIEKLANVMTQHSLTELSVESEDMKLVLKRGSDAAPAVQAPSPQPPPQPASAAPQGHESSQSQAEADDTAQETGEYIRSPIVGTFYSAPSPDEEPYIGVGDRVTEDTVVCIIEAMKVMNEIKADKTGKISKVLVDNATPVEYNQPLFQIESD